MRAKQSIETRSPLGEKAFEALGLMYRALMQISSVDRETHHARQAFRMRQIAEGTLTKVNLEYTEVASYAFFAAMGKKEKP